VSPATLSISPPGSSADRSLAAWSTNTVGQPSERETPGQRLWMNFGTGQGTNAIKTAGKRGIPVAWPAVPSAHGTGRPASCWPGRQQRVLDQIEKRLLGDDLRLGSLFAVFTRLASEDAMPPTERLKQGRGACCGQLLAAAVGSHAGAPVITRPRRAAHPGGRDQTRGRRLAVASGRFPGTRRPGTRTGCWVVPPDYRLISHLGERRVL
jgi:hypothetical protein